MVWQEKTNYQTNMIRTMLACQISQGNRLKDGVGRGSRPPQALLLDAVLDISIPR